MITQAQIDHIGEQWDGCMYDAPGMMIDIGQSIRAELAKIAASSTVTLDGHQLRMALDFINPDGLCDRDQLDNDLTFGVRQHQDDDGKVSTGMCCWNDDSDGVLPLDGEYDGTDPVAELRADLAAAHALLSKHCVADLKDGKPATLAERIEELWSWHEPYTQGWETDKILVGAAQAVVRQALDDVSVHPCDYHDDAVRAKLLHGPVLSLHTVLSARGIK